MTPLERVLGALRAKGSEPAKAGAGWVARCPAHEDHSPSLSVSEGEGGKVLLNCFSGCTWEAVAAALGMGPGDLFPEKREPHTPETPKAPPTLAGFAKARRLLETYLKDTWGVEEVTHKGRPALRYPTPQGVRRVKYLDGKRPKYTWERTGGHAHLYGLTEARELGGEVLYLVNGEPSVWACHLERVPAACLLGESARLTKEMVEELGASGFKRLRVVYDRDAAGRKGAHAAAAALRDAHLDALALELPSYLGDKADADDLHRWAPDDLRAALERLPELDPPGPIFSMRPLSEVDPEVVSWLWEPYIPAGKITLLQSDPGEGKTFAALDLCARLTREGRPCIFASLEDGVGDTLRPRAELQGADLSMLYAFEGRRGEDGDTLPVTLADIEPLAAAVEAHTPALLVLDPISAWLGSQADMFRANEVRGRLAPLVRLAQARGCAVLILQHLTKAPTLKALHRGQGSMDFVAAARSVLLLGKTPEGQRGMVHIKSSLGSLGPALGYTIGREGFQWTGELEIEAGDLLGGDASPEERSNLEEAADWLRHTLEEEGGECLAGRLLQDADRAGIQKHTLRRARSKLGITNRKVGFGRDGGWVWSLPPNGDNPDTKGLVDTNGVTLGEIKAPKGLEGGHSTKGDKETVYATFVTLGTDKGTEGVL